MVPYSQAIKKTEEDRVTFAVDGKPPYFVKDVKQPIDDFTPWLDRFSLSEDALPEVDGSPLTVAEVLAVAQSVKIQGKYYPIATGIS